MWISWNELIASVQKKKQILKTKNVDCENLSASVSKMEKNISEIKRSTLYERNREYKKTISVLESEILSILRKILI